MCVSVGMRHSFSHWSRLDMATSGSPGGHRREHLALSKIGSGKSSAIERTGIPPRDHHSASFHSDCTQTTHTKDGVRGAAAAFLQVGLLMILVHMKVHECNLLRCEHNTRELTSGGLQSNSRCDRGPSETRHYWRATLVRLAVARPKAVLGGG